MSDTTGIEWTDATWNPIRGCRRTAPSGSKLSGCGDPTGGGCYAERTAARFCGPGQPYDGLIKVTKDGPRWSGKVKFVAEHLYDPLRWKKPRRIFVNSMSDLFYEAFTDAERDLVLAVMLLAPHHTFQVLTKRAATMRSYLSNPGLYERVLVAASMIRTEFPKLSQIGISNPSTSPAPWIWWGVSVENQAAADERVPELLRTPAGLRFLSCEPLIGPVDLSAWLPRREPHTLSPDGTDFVCSRCGCRWDDEPHECPPAFGGRVGWAIVGCESGPGSRRADVGWLRVLRDQCAAAGVAYFLKQAQAVDLEVDEGNGSHRKAGGLIGAPYLDGRQHIEFPEVTRG